MSVLQIRVREAAPGEKLELDAGHTHQTVEVLSPDGHVLGELPVTGCSYSMTANRLGELTLTFPGGGADFRTMS